MDKYYKEKQRDKNKKRKRTKKSASGSGSGGDDGGKDNKDNSYNKINLIEVLLKLFNELRRILTALVNATLEPRTNDGSISIDVRTLSIDIDYYVIRLVDIFYYINQVHPQYTDEITNIRMGLNSMLSTYFNINNRSNSVTNSYSIEDIENGISNLNNILNSLVRILNYIYPEFNTIESYNMEDRSGSTNNHDNTGSDSVGNDSTSNTNNHDNTGNDPEAGNSNNHDNN